MGEMTPCIMMCDRIEEGRFCVLVGKDGKVLSVPIEALSATPEEKEFYSVTFKNDGCVTLTPTPTEKEERLERLRALRKRLIGKRKRDL